MSLLSNGITLIHLDSVMRLTNNYQLLESKLRKIFSGTQSQRCFKCNDDLPKCKES